MGPEEIKEARTARGMTQAEAAKLLGVSQGTLSRWESGRGRPRTSKIPELRQLLSGLPSTDSPHDEPEAQVAPLVGGTSPASARTPSAPDDGSTGASSVPVDLRPLPTLELPEGSGRTFLGPGSLVAHTDAVVALGRLPDDCVDLVFADPPYNIGKRFANFHDKWPSDAAYVEWCKEWLTECLRVLRPDGSLYVMTSTQAMPYLDIWLRERTTVLSRIVWHYDSSGVQAKSYFGSLYEPILHCVADRRAYTFNSGDIEVEAKTGGKRKLIDYRKAVPTVYNSKKVPGNVWYFARVRYRMPEYEEHPSQKPQALLDRIVRASSSPGDVVLDPFCGTFTTGAVALGLGRRFIGVESQLKYVKVGLRRLGVCDELDGEALLPPEKSHKRRNGKRVSKTAAPAGSGITDEVEAEPVTADAPGDGPAIATSEEHPSGQDEVRASPTGGAGQQEQLFGGRG